MRQEDQRLLGLWGGSFCTKRLVLEQKGTGWLLDICKDDTDVP